MFLRSFIVLIGVFSIIQVISGNEPIRLRNANELIGEHTEIVDKRTLVGNVILQQKNVIVTANRAIQYLNSNKFHLTGNVIITQDSLVLKSESILYDGNIYLAISDVPLEITDGNTKLIGDSGTYSTETMVATFIDNIKLEDDSVII